MSNEEEIEWDSEYQASDKVVVDYIEWYKKLPRVEDSFPDGVVEFYMPNPESDTVLIVHMPTNGGYYLSQVLSCSESLLGSDLVNHINDKLSWLKASYSTN